MTKFTTNEMVIAYGKARKQVSIEFNPPMLAGQARKRLEELHNESRTALGLVRTRSVSFRHRAITYSFAVQSPIKINSIRLSKSTSIVLAVATILQVALVVSPGELLVTNMPWLATKATALLQYLDLNSATLSVGTVMKLLLVVPLQSAHLGEAILFLMPLMRKFNMTSPSVRLFYVSSFVSSLHPFIL
jgi:hypothetical protein